MKRTSRSSDLSAHSASTSERTATADRTGGSPTTLRLLIWLLCTLLFYLAVQRGGPRLLLLPPILANAVMLYLFARSLLPGREAQITRFHRLIHHRVGEEARRYTRLLTLYWVVFFAAVLSAAVIAAHAPGSEAWAWLPALGAPAAAALFFLAEHCYRAKYRRHYGSAPLLQTLDTIRRPEAWQGSLEEFAAKR